MSWIIEHKEMLLAGGISLLDFLMAISPKLKSAGWLHAIYLALGGKETPPPAS